MSLRDFYVQRRKAELPAFLKVLQAVPVDQLGYKPAERSPSTEQIVWILTWELKSCLDIIADGKTEWKTVPPPPLEEMISMFERWSNELIEAVSGMDDAAWERKAQFFVGDKIVSEQPTGQFLWFVLFDAIHHRGQLSAYLRPMGAKVPSIYGPSADEQMKT